MEDLSKRLVERLNDALAELRKAQEARTEFSAELARAERAPSKILEPGHRFSRQTDARRRKLETILTEALEMAEALEQTPTPLQAPPPISPANLAGHFRSLVDAIQQDARSPQQGEVGTTLKSVEVEVKGLIVVDQNEARILTPTPSRGIDAEQLSTVKMSFGVIPVLRTADQSPAETADLSIRKTGSVTGSTATGNFTIKFAIEVENLGPSEAKNVAIADQLDAAIVVRVSDFQTTQGKWNVTALPRLEAQLGNLPAGQIVTLAYLAEAKPFEKLVTSATVRSDTIDPQTANNVMTMTLTPPEPPQQADLAISKTGLLSAGTASKVAKYTLVVSNQGPSVAKNVVVIDRPERSAVSRVTEFFADPKGKWTNQEMPTLKAELGDLKPGESVKLGYVAFFNATAQMAINQAEVSSETPDPAMGNNQDSFKLKL